MCLPQCIDITISEEVLQQSLEDEKKLLAQKGDNNPTTLKLHSRMNLVGALAQNVVFESLDDWGVPYEGSPVFNPNRHNDDFDFRTDRGNIDIQGKPMTLRDGTIVQDVYPNTKYYVKNEKRDRNMQYFCFVSLSAKRRIAHIAGIISCVTLWGLHQEANLTHPCHFVYARQLTSLRDFMFHI